jgi:hypothetical protein
MRKTLRLMSVLVGVAACSGSAENNGPDGGAGPDGGVTADAGGVKRAADVRILSVYHGLDDSLQSAICEESQVTPLDGIPVVFAEELDPTSLQPEDFQMTLQDGGTRTPDCITLLPAVNSDENRTVLLIGDLGVGREVNTVDGFPVALDIVGEILSDGDDALVASFQGTHFEIPSDQYYSEGLFLVHAQTFTSDEDDANNPCPADRTTQRVRIIFSGGATEPIDNPVAGSPEFLFVDDFGCDISGAQASVPMFDNSGNPCVCADNGSNDCDKFAVLGNNGVTYHPFAFGDVFDGDNNLELCMDAPADVVFTLASAKAGCCYDPAPGMDPNYQDDLSQNVNALTEVAIP